MPFVVLRDEAHQWLAILASITVLAGLPYLLLRWMRWHSLLKGTGSQLPTSQSLALYMETYPWRSVSILGEWIRVFTMRYAEPGVRIGRRLRRVWLTETVWDAFFLVAMATWLSPFQLQRNVAVWLFLLAAAVTYGLGFRRRAWFACIFLSCLPWCVLIGGLTGVGWMYAVSVQEWVQALVGVATLFTNAAPDAMRSLTQETALVALVLVSRGLLFWLSLIIAALAQRSWLGDGIKGHRLKREGRSDMLPTLLDALSVIPKESARGLEIGSGRGETVAALSARGFGIEGFEPRDLAREQWGVWQAAPTPSPKGLPFLNDSFDFILVATYMAAMRKQDWPTFLAELERILKPGGLVIIASLKNPKARTDGSWIRSLIPSPFFKQTGTELWPSPTRIKQLLTWSGGFAPEPSTMGSFWGGGGCLVILKSQKDDLDALPRVA